MAAAVALPSVAAAATVQRIATPDLGGVICGVPTRFACLRFSNRVFLTISQLPSFGSLYLAEVERYLDGSRFFNIRSVLGCGMGGGNEEISDAALLCARRIAELIFIDCGVDLLLSLALRPSATTAEAAREIIEFLQVSKPWLDRAGAGGGLGGTSAGGGGAASSSFSASEAAAGPAAVGPASGASVAYVSSVRAGPGSKARASAPLAEEA